MSYRRTSEYDETDYYTRSRGNGGRGREVDEVDIRERRRIVSRSPSRTRRRADYDEVDVRVRERSVSRTPAFLREDVRRNETSGAMVLRQREVEEVARAPVRRPRSPSPARFRERIITRQRDRSPSIVDEREVERTRIVDRERMVERPRSPVERVRTRIVERERSPSPVERERERIRIVERRRESPSPSPSPPPPPPPPQVIRGPTIEREVITHYTDIDHGMIKVRPPSPPPPPRPTHTHKDTEIDIYTSNHSTEVDIHRSKSRHRSRERKSPRVERVVDDELVIDRRRTEDRLRIDDLQVSRRRSHSAAPPRHSYDDEAEYITSKIDRHGKMGEAWHGATRDWTIVDVPPGTERVRMDGVGGGAAEVTWQRYNGVRRSKFIPERDDVVANVASSSSTSIEIDDRSRQRDHRDRLSVRVEDRETEVEIEKERRVAVRPRQQEMWTEITKDLVSREAIEHFGYAYEETDYFYYIMQYLRQDEVMRIVEYSDSLRNRRVRHREIEWDREYYDDREVRRSHQHRSRHRRGSFDHEDYREREVIVDHRPGRTYIL